MKTKTMYYVGGAVLAYILYKKMSAPAAAPAVPAPGLKETVSMGAYTGNRMLEELGTLGCSGSQVPGIKGY